MTILVAAIARCGPVAPVGPIAPVAPGCPSGPVAPRGPIGPDVLAGIVAMENAPAPRPASPTIRAAMSAGTIHPRPYFTGGATPARESSLEVVVNMCALPYAFQRAIDP